MKIIILSALGDEVLSRCLESLQETSPYKPEDVHVVREQGSREDSLNQGLAEVGRDDDPLFIGDDIVFTPGWFAAFQTQRDFADILGMTMQYPETGLVQDRGYDLVKIDGRVVLEARDRGLTPEKAAEFPARHCDAVCGCFFFVRREVFRKVSSFQKEGLNRWGEFIFICAARQAGFTAGVIGHDLIHGGVSTKSNPEKSLSSTSYLVEKEIWSDLVERYVSLDWIGPEKQTIIASEFEKLVCTTKGDILFYGTGTITEALLAGLPDEVCSRLEFCSGLPEEVGRPYAGRTIMDVTKCDLPGYDLIVMTPLNVGARLVAELITPQLAPAYRGTVVHVEAIMVGTCRELHCRPRPAKSPNRGR